MSATISHKLKNSLQGALAGGGDPATSPLYVFGPFLSLIVAGGAAEVTFGTSIWLAVFTVIAVSAMYRYVMIWITDGSGGSGLSEEELGSWAVKLNAAITVIEYTLTFLVSMAALVTFLADRFTILGSHFLGLNIREILAVLLSLAVVWTVNRGSRVSALFFGPATALILIFLWTMVGFVIWKHGLQIPSFHWRAFHPEFLNLTLGGFARILALMTGIEIFANLVASYEGSSRERSKKAFGSLLLVMGTTAITMIVVGPAILDLSNPADVTKSVFTQTMDALLPSWLSYAGTLIGVAVLLSAAAASAQGIQNLALGLRARHYIPAKWGKRNKFDVPSFPAWLQGGIVVLAFLLFGTHEETYLALYAAGVFILLSLTGFSAAKRFLRKYREKKSLENFVGFFITVFSTLCASFATAIIFAERFLDGAWSYLLMIPALYFAFDFYRKKLGAPSPSLDSHLVSVINASPQSPALLFDLAPYKIRKILVPLNGDPDPEVAFHAAMTLGSRLECEIYPFHVRETKEKKNMDGYFTALQKSVQAMQKKIQPIIQEGNPVSELVNTCESGNYDLICMASSNMKSADRLVRNPIPYKVIYATTPPILFLRPTNRWGSRWTEFKKILLPLDGSKTAEQVIPYALAWALEHQSTVTLLTVPEEQGHAELNEKLASYLKRVSETFEVQGIPVSYQVIGSGPARTVLAYAKEEAFDLIALVSHGRGGLDRQDYVKLGNVTETVFSESDIPILFISGKKS